MPISTRALSELPSIRDLRRITQSLATLDAILCAEWGDRYHSFNSRWSDDGEVMASMRDGSGDEWFILFSAAGAAIKGFAHEMPMSPVASPPERRFVPVVQRGHALYPGLLDGFPDELAPFLAEPAFALDATTFIVWRLATASEWHIGEISWPPGRDPDGSEDLLALLDGNPESYAAWASDYFERPVAAEDAAHVFAHRPLDETLLVRLGSERSLEELAEDLAEIGYPAA